MVQVAILGFGTVGSGVAEVLTQNADAIARKAGGDVRVKYILDTRDFPDSPFSDLVVHDFSVIESDPEVQVVAECIGGATVAYDFVRRSLLAGKHVVTSNKEMVAAHGYELLSIAREKNVNFLFEASVGGGIPILRPLAVCFSANEISEIYGILNGTTNYILTKMINEGADFDEVLREAQAKGYAEANPAADVEGPDACRKICILSALSFGRHVYPESVHTEGITGITTQDIAFAEKANMKVKLLGRAVKTDDGKVVCYVSPHFVPASAQIARVDDVFNGIVVRGNAVGETMFYGRGAGKLPTASAVVADIIDAINHAGQRKNIFWEDADPAMQGDYQALEQCWFVRTDAKEAEIAASLPGAKLLGEVDGQVGVLTGPMSLNALLESGLHMMGRIPVL
ncbi:MAG: homoserine dehydrogenase [Ruminococcaceae bacterium]|nr:homoserine dehydrogenase [Oscillospiraceae bacterium]